MSRRTYTYNAWESSLNGAINTAATTIALNSVTNLRSPGLLVIDPDTPAKREYIKFGSINGSSIESVTRNLGGGVLSAHDDGAIIRAVPMHQFFDDTFTDIEDIETAAASHTGAANPHSGSASTAALAVTDGNVATNTAGVAANATNLATHEAAGHVVHEFVDAATFTWTSINTLESIVADVVNIPTSWITYDLVLRGGGMFRSNFAATVTPKLRVHSAAPGYAAFGVDGVTFRAQGLYEISDVAAGSQGQRIAFTVVGKNRLGPITRTAYPSATVKLEGEINSLSGVSIENPWIEAEAKRRS